MAFILSLIGIVILVSLVIWIVASYIHTSSYLRRTNQEVYTPPFSGSESYIRAKREKDTELDD